MNYNSQDNKVDKEIVMRLYTIEDGKITGGIEVKTEGIPCLSSHKNISVDLDDSDTDFLHLSYHRLKQASLREVIGRSQNVVDSITTRLFGRKIAFPFFTKSYQLISNQESSNSSLVSIHVGDKDSMPRYSCTGGAKVLTKSNRRFYGRWALVLMPYESVIKILGVAYDKATGRRRDLTITSKDQKITIAHSFESTKKRKKGNINILS